MIKGSVMYPNTPEARFDQDYYRDIHMPLVQERMGKACLYYTVDRGITAGADVPAPYIAMCHIFCDSLETFQASFGPNAEEILADIRNYTDLEPVMQFSAVVIGH